MKPIDFPGANIVFAKDQPQYQPLPAMLLGGPEYSVISCWELTEEEKQEIARTGRLYIKQLTFGNPLQPILPTIDLSDGIELI